MTYGPTLTSRTVAVCTALTIAVALGLGSTALAAPQQHPVNAATADQPQSGGPRLSGLRPAPDAAAVPSTADQARSGGPRLSGLRPSTAATASDSNGFPWGVAAIGSVVALGLIGLAMSRVSRARSRTQTGPAALSH